MKPRIILSTFALTCALAFALLFSLSSPLPSAAQVTVQTSPSAPTLDATPPATPVRLVFIHHSSGGNWLANALRAELNANNYFVTETDYGWPYNASITDKIGDRTDIGHWFNWFAGAKRDTYMSWLYPNSYGADSNSGVTDPGGENQIIMFKSCFPNSNLGGNASDPPTTGANPLRGQPAGSEYMTVGNAKGIYNDILAYFATRPDKLFIVITAPPLEQNDTSSDQATNARAFNNWLVHDWLAGYSQNNVAVFDFYNTLTSNSGNPNTNDYGQTAGNHHRYLPASDSIQHVIGLDNNYSSYAFPGDSHPTAAGNQKAAKEYVPLLNVYYHRWLVQLTPKVFLPRVSR